MLVAEVPLPDDIALRSHNFPLQLKMADGEELSFRLYAYNSESNSGSWTLAANTLRVLGSAMPSCAPPTTPATIQLNSVGTQSAEVTVSAGNGQGRLLVVAPTGAPLPKPYQGEAYLGNTIYGLGELLGVASYVIGSTTAASSIHTITGLTPGVAYQLFVYEYNAGAMCYARSPASLTFTTQCTPTPQRVQQVHYTSLDGRVAIQWEGVHCFDKYLVVASAQPIVGSPVGANFSNSSHFGTGATPNGFAAGVYSVFSAGNREEVVVTNLANGTLYYFAIFVRLGDRWSTGYYFNSQPAAACSRLGYERIFINEFHYLNGPVSQDQGVEIAGPAGIDLSNYALVVYLHTGNINSFAFEVYRHQLAGVIDDEGAGFGAVWFPVALMPPNRGSIRLVNTITGEVVDFVDYDPISGIRDILSRPHFYPFGPGDRSLLEFSDDPAGYSLQRVGQGHCPTDFHWLRLPQSRGRLNVGQSVFPVELTFLAGEAKGPAARVFWQTASEANSDFFVVEASTDGRTFTELGKVAAAGFSQEFQNYEFWDYRPAPGTNYYRLWQVDFDGSRYDEGIVLVNFADTGKPGGVRAFPNPVVDRTTVSWSGQAETLRLSDAQGRVLQSIALADNPAGGSQSVDLSALPPGLYFLHLSAGERVEVVKVIKR
ncbi:MAG: hypothetical protein DA408_16750 [Bacteroidetes bacterium]|nr:MAG: hypothetical protein DA408_16750 [Bacteroidota bacterium]